MPDDDDDLLTTAYLQDTAVQAGLDCRMLQMPEIGWNGRHFVDLDTGRIDALFKLYPWDWLAEEPFFPHLAASAVTVLEPAWRVVPASKGILPILWELFPGHPNLLPAAFHADALAGPKVLKPLFGREGANIAVRDAEQPSATDGPYADMGTVAQAFHPLPDFDGWRPVIGLWTVAGGPHGIGVREDRSLITGRGARFVPHLIRD
jgi:glutathionylspermidine synthase